MSTPERHDLPLAPELHPRLALLFAQLEDVRADLTTLARRWRDAELDLELVPGFFNPGALLLHLAEVESWWIRVVAGGQGAGDPPTKLPDDALAPFTMDPEGAPVAGGRPLADYLSALAGARTWTRSFLSSLDAGELSRELTYRGRDAEEYVFSLEWVLHHLVEHEAHHRGQLALLRRLAGPEA